MKGSLDFKELMCEVEKEIEPACKNVREICLENQHRVLNVFKEARVSDHHLKGSTGYGYNDPGREVLDNVYAEIFGAEAALVRGQIASGTHAIALCLFGILRPGDKLLSINGAPYDTLQKVVGIRGRPQGSLTDWGIQYEQVELLPVGELDWPAIERALEFPVRMVMIQRSRGYSLRRPLDVHTIGSIVNLVRSKQPNAVIFVDNCYGEFVETLEPPSVGVDITAGSLIKNPGGGLAPTGGYIVGRKELVQAASFRLTAPGIGSDVGATLDWHRMFFQGLFLAPSVVSQALKGAIFTARLFERLGFEVSPSFKESRTDIVQAVILGSASRLVAFCQAVQSASPIDSHVRPEPWAMPGYEDPVVMAAGTFVQGGSLELTADGPLREPYAAYFQGGLTFEHVKIAALSAAEQVLKVSDGL